MKLRSIDYAEIIRRYAYGRFGVSLGKTQVIKLLYILYGMYYARSQKEDDRLFDDDKFYAWPYGPVVPEVYKYLSYMHPNSISEEVMDEIKNPNNKDKMALICEVVSKKYDWSANDLTKWSHEKGSPWYKTVYGENGDRPAIWGEEISDKYIKEYFKSFAL